MLRFFIEKLQLSSNAAKSGPICSSNWLYTCRKTICSQVESSSSSVLSPDPEKSQIISYLVSACGLSSVAALSAAKFVGNKTKEKTISVIRLLKGYDFSEAQINIIVIKRSSLLVANSQKTLKPKLDFLLNEGFSKEEVADIFVANPTLLARNIERGLVSTCRFLSASLPSRSDVVVALKGGNQCLTVENESSIKMLRDLGMAEPVIMYILKRFPMALMRSTGHLEEAIKKLMEMGLDPKRKMFAYALGHISYISKATWHRKMELYKELGWSESEVISLFKRCPSVFCLSDERLRYKVNFFKTSLGWDPGFISVSPVLLQFSFEKRILPRVSALKLLMSKGVIEKQWKQSQFYIPDRLFIIRYIEKHVNEVPEVTDVYHDAIAIDES